MLSLQDPSLSQVAVEAPGFGYFEGRIGNPRTVDVAIRTVAGALVRCGLTEYDDVRRDVIVADGELVVTPDTVQTTPFARASTFLETTDADVMKRWVGLSDATALAAPEVAWTFDAAEIGDPVAWLAKATYSDDEQAVLDRLVRAYVFGLSTPLRPYKALVEHYRRFKGRQYPEMGEVFRVHALLARYVSIAPGARLVVEGPLPTVLIADHMDIHEGGSLALQTITYMTVGYLRKVDPAQGGTDA